MRGHRQNLKSRGPTSSEFASCGSSPALRRNSPTTAAWNGVGYRRLPNDAEGLLHLHPIVIVEGGGWFLRRYDACRAIEFLNFIAALSPLIIVSFRCEEEIRSCGQKVSGSQYGPRGRPWHCHYEETPYHGLLVHRSAAHLDRGGPANRALAAFPHR
jgi:hypothetical protein